MSAPPKFTPGPWLAPPYSSVVGLGIVGPLGHVIATVAVQPGFNPTAAHEVAREIVYADEVRANAHLIAAAPELYEALAELVGSCTGSPVGSGDGDTYVVAAPTPQASRKAVAALAKARGQG